MNDRLGGAAGVLLEGTRRMISALTRWSLRMASTGCLAISLSLPGVARAETLADALVAAYRNSNVIEQNRAVLRAADEDVASAVATLRPVIQWVASAAHSDTLGGQNTDASLGLQADLLIYDFGRSALGIEVAKELVLATRQALVGVEQNILLSTVAAYFDVRSAIQNVSINENSVRVLGETLRQTRDRFDVGEVTRTDVALAEARVAAARAGLAAAEGQLAAAREAYRALTDAYPGQLAPAPRQPTLPRSVGAAQSIAQRSHPAILQAQHEVRAADLRVELAAAQRLPQLSGRVAAGINDTSSDNASIGLTMQQTIYSGGALSATHRKAIAARDAARSALLQSSVLVVQNVANSWAQIEVARAQIAATEREIAAATIAYDGVNEEATLGARTTLDVLDAEQALLDARSRRITAEAQLQVAYYSLLESMGLMTAEYLNLGVPIYDPEGYYNAVKNAPSTSVQGRSLDRVLQAIGRN